MTLLSTEAVDEQATDDTPSAGGTAAVHDMTANDISKLKSMFAAKTDTMGPVGDVGSVNPAFDDTENTVSPHEGELHNDEAPVIDIAENSNLIISSNANNNVTSITDIPLSPMKTSAGADDEEDAPAVVTFEDNTITQISPEEEPVITNDKYRSNEKVIVTSKSSVLPLEEESSAWCGQKENQWCTVM